MKSKRRLQKNPNIRTEIAKRKEASSLYDGEAEVVEETVVITEAAVGITADTAPRAEATRSERKKQANGKKPTVTKVVKIQRKSKSRTRKIIWALASIATLLSVLGSGWLYLDYLDHENAHYVPLGVTLNGTSLAGMSQTQVSSTLADIIAGYESTEITLDVGQNYIPIMVGDYISTDPNALTEEIMQVRLDTPLWERLLHDYFDGIIPAEFETGFLIDSAGVALIAENASAHYSYAATNATLYFEGFTPVITDSATGFWVDPEHTAQDIENAIIENLNGNEVLAVEASYTITNPEVTKEDLMVPVLTCNIGARQVMLWNGDELVKTYPCAVGQPKYPTIPGQYYIGAKEVNPPWYNPDPDGWGKGAPKFIPGPNDALGVRGLHIFTLEGFNTMMLFHGALGSGLAGTATTHGCIRMFNNDVIDLYERVPVGTSVSLSY